jgi:hypothetical protein
MGIARPKLTPAPELTTPERLSAARDELARIEGEIINAVRERDLALLDDDADGVRRAETTAADLVKEKERAARRVMLLEERAAAELKARQDKAQTDLIDRSATDLRERDAATAEMVEHMQAMITAFRRALKAGNAAVSGWPFSFGDSQAALIGFPFVHAIAAELYRLSGDDLARAPAFPGAQCPDVRDPRPQSVKPIAEKVAEATAYALRVMRESPVRPLPIAASPPPAAPSIAPLTSSTAKPAIQPLSESEQSEEPRLAEYAWLLEIIETATGKRTTERIVLTPEQAEECYLDGVGPVGPRGREMALRLAAAKASEGLQVDGRSLRFDMAALARSLEDN